MKVAIGARILGYGLIIFGFGVALGWALAVAAAGFVMAVESILDEVQS